MVGRDDVNLTAAEWAAFSELETRAAADRRLRRRLHTRRRRRHLRLAALRVRSGSSIGAILLVAAGLATTVLSLSTALALGLVGIVLTMVGLWLVGRQLRRRWLS